MLQQLDDRVRTLGTDQGEWSEVEGPWGTVPVFQGELWTSRQRQAHNLHEISYRACYKPQLPRHFIERLTEPGEVVYDPFGGRGTTALEAALLGREVISNDVNPLSMILLEPRLDVPDLASVARRLDEIPYWGGTEEGMDLSMFFHPDTEMALRAVRTWILDRQAACQLDAADRWIRMVATNRLTGHSAGFFSVYTLPPNQAASPERQRQINAKRNQVPPVRDVKDLILRKTRQLLRTLSGPERSRLHMAARGARLLTKDARTTPEIPSGSVALTVTSPPFLDVVQYASDNWMRCWFNGLQAEAIGKSITASRNLKVWEVVMGDVFRELFRITRPGGFVAFEVGEVRKGTIRLEEVVLPLGVQEGFEPSAVLINQQSFTKTAHIWGVGNNGAGTNSNRIVLFRKP